jgi:nucleoside-diphosphate-sugar epimerase
MVLLTGASGYLGGHVYTSLEDVKRGWDPEGCDTVIHLAWHAVPGDKEPELQQDSLKRTIELAERCRGRNVRMVFASTASVYGDTEAICDETHHIDPRCAYTRSKLAAEKLLEVYFKERLCVLRMGSLMGQGVTRTKRTVIVNAFATSDPIECWNPDCWKPVLHVKDAALIVLRAASERWSGIYNVAEGSYRAIDIANRVSAITGARVEEVEDRNGRRSVRMDCDKLRMKCGLRMLRVEEAVRELTVRAR